MEDTQRKYAKFMGQVLETFQEETMISKGKERTVAYKFEDDVLKFWEDDAFESENEDFNEIDINDLIDWDTVNGKAIQAMKEQYPKGTTFICMDDNNPCDNTD
jgi:hypothetical protein